MKLRGLALAALILGLLGTRDASAQGGSPIKDLRLLDAQGQPLERVEIEPGDYYFPLPEGATKLTAAFDFSGTQVTEVKLRVMGNEGVSLFEESRQVDAPGTVTFTYDAKDQPLETGEYYINLYVGKESYLSDSVQVYVGDAKPAVSQATQIAAQTQAVPGASGATTGDSAPADSASSPAPADTTGGSIPGNRNLLVLAGAGLLALLGIVLWAGRSAMRRG